MTETTLKLKLPAEVTIHIPSFSDQSLERCLKIAAEQGVELIEGTMKRMIAREIYAHHRMRIKNFVKKKVALIEHEKIEELEKLLTEKIESFLEETL